ncbi:MAG TPA: M6 family metalloprotease domain-containing protein [Saprospiraceae bacterium]|nr:M6 family metalloprotease domain-containing protein [Saprospiraceae bacterium]
MRFFQTFFLFLLSLTAFSSNYNGEIKTFSQPDGSQVDVRLFGSEFYMRAEGLDGYTLVRDDASKWICYARLSEDGRELIATEYRYFGSQSGGATLNVDPGVPKHLDIRPEYVQEVMNHNAQSLFGLPTVEAVQNSYTTYQRSGEVLQGNLKGLCIIVDFSDEVATLKSEDYIDFCNGLNYVRFGNNGSLRQYYLDISGGLLDYQNVVFGIFRAPRTFQEYDAMPYTVGAQQILDLALNWIKSTGFDFSTLSTNPDKTIQAINLMYTGNPPSWAKGMWFHQGYYSGFSANGVRSGRYNTSPAKSPLTIGTVVHENGHMICKWPDTYKYDNKSGPDGIGPFDVMCSGGPDANPTLPNPYFMHRIGWLRDTDVTGKNEILTDTANAYAAYSYRNPDNPTEYYMFQNRLKTGRSEGIPDEGLVVWRINENGDNQTTNHQVYVVHQNNNINDHSGACFRKGRMAEYNDSTTPSSRWWISDIPSGLRLWDFSNKGPVMTYKIGRGPSLTANYLNYDNDSNADGYITGGEEFDLNVRLFNVDAGLSSSSIVTCTPIGTNATKVNVLTASIQPGEIASGDSLDITFRIVAKAALKDFETVEFKIDVEEDGRSFQTYASIVTGTVYIMDSTTIIDCDYNFLDSGGLSTYNNGTTVVKTIFPADSTKKMYVEWLSFDLEESNGCKKDILRIYNGENTSAPLIGKLCGSKLPGNIIADNPSGALTFLFKTDPLNAYQGWHAKVTCVERSATEQMIHADIRLFPNPAGNVLNISMGAPMSGNIIITDLLGNIIRNRELRGENLIQLSTDGLHSGVYFASIRFGKNLITRKFIIE